MSATRAIQNSSTSLIIRTLNTTINRSLSRGEIIRSKNRYVNNTRNKINHISLGNAKKSDLSEYITASLIVHCLDGWIYFSRAIDSLLNKDINNTIHLLYYSELRAVMSIMACEGIGIFDRKHIYFDNSNNIQIITGIKTHDFARDLLDEWKNSPNKIAAVFDVVSLNNHKLSDWFNATGRSINSPISMGIIKDWLSIWNADLSLREEQTARNIVSYRPSFRLNDISLNNILDNLCEIWQALEPSSGSSFKILDMHLVRIAIEHIYKLSTGKIANKRSRNYLNYVNSTFSHLGEPNHSLTYDFMIRKKESNNHLILRYANKNKREFERLKQPIPMICRSILLLRLASGNMNRIIAQSNIPNNQFDLWWKQVAYKIGLINDPNDGLLQPFDLFTDIQEAINEIKGSNISHSLKDTVKSSSISVSLQNISKFQPIHFWSLYS